jgi:hypothetical protein
MSSLVAKPNEIIGVVFEQDLDLLSRKLFNLIIYHSQNKYPQELVPANLAAENGYLWVPMTEFVADAAFKSRDTERLQACLVKLQGLKVQSGIKLKAWQSDVILPSIRIEKHGGRLWVGWWYLPAVAAMINNPDTYTRLALNQQAQLKTTAGHALWEICRRYATNPSHLTACQPIEWWRERLGTHSNEFRYWKRDVLNPAINEVSRVAGLELEPIETTHGRKVVALQFRVIEGAQVKLPLSPEPLIDSLILDPLIAFGLSEHDAQRIIIEYSRDKVLEAIRVTTLRMHTENVAPLENPAGFFRSALRGGYKLPAPKPAKREPAPSQQLEVLPLSPPDPKRKAAEAEILAMSEATQASLIAEFIATSDNRAAIAAIRKSGLSGMMGRMALIRWYVNRAPV